MNRAERVPSISQRDHVPLILPAGPASGAAATEQPTAAVSRASTVVECHVFPSADIAQDAADPSVITLQAGATVIGTANNAAAGGITKAAGIALTLDSANVDVADGAVLKLVVTNAGAGAQNLSGTAFYGTCVLRPVD